MGPTRDRPVKPSNYVLRDVQGARWIIRHEMKPSHVKRSLSTEYKHPSSQWRMMGTGRCQDACAVGELVGEWTALNLSITKRHGEDWLRVDESCVI